DFAESQRYLRVRVERWVAAGEDEPEAVVGHGVVVRLRVVVRERDVCVSLRQCRLRRVEPRVAAQLVDGLESSRRNEPRASIGGDPVSGPLLERGGKSVVQRLLGEVEITEEADERREYAARVGAVDLTDLL